MAANRDVLADVNVEKLIYLVQGYVSVRENAAIINSELFLKNKLQIPRCYPVFKVVFITGNL